ncbi:lipolytic enzyme [Microsporum canis CBS 113480]|uniref:Lipolytic enzyme n=1 Tax=Arthroderma otae (strain ATCC MYA-4605 / CBS 113480) TaxID=554155 RepID=C5FQS9_ARTOC|nr:lipolytic enzyme [Microsporum canis CBS 113480]EEQ32232.1 lipolytic enzyme [Microsporum canis CBS 113480]
MKIPRRAVDFNTALPEIVGKRVSAGYKVFLMDGYSPLSFVANDFADSLHPNDQGYGKLATAWYNAIAFADNQLGWISKPVAGGGTRPHLIPCDKNPIWIPNGEIANGAGLGQDLYPYLTCGEKRGDEGTCVCGSRIDGPTGSDDMDVPKEGSNCHDMSYDPTHAVHFADLDGDGRAEFLWVGSKGEVTAFYNQGLPGGQQSTNGAQVGWWPAGVIASGVGATPYQVHFADLNGDGRAEYIHVHRNGSASVWLNQGPKPGSDPRGAQVAWLPQKQTAMGVGGERHQIMFADINGDGKADHLFFPNYPPLGSGDGGRGNVQMWRNGGGPDDGPHAAEPVWYPEGEIATGDGTPPYQVMFADLNGDGRAEYIEVNRDTSAVKAYLNACPK